MLMPILIAVVATDVAVAVMFVTLRRHLLTPPAAGLDTALTAEMEGLVVEMRTELDQATAELTREKAQLRRMLADAERRNRPEPATTPAPALTPVITRRDVLRLAAEGHSFRVIAGRTGMSVEEVRLMLAMEQELAA